MFYNAERQATLEASNLSSIESLISSAMRSLELTSADLNLKAGASSVHYVIKVGLKPQRA